MKPIPLQQVARALEALWHRVATGPRLHAELLRAGMEFHGPRGPGSELAELRFREWFLLERDSEGLGDVPLTAVTLAPGEDVLRGSLVIVGVVEQLENGVAEVRDLQNDQVAEVHVRAHDVRLGDLLVGRLFPQPDGSLLPSTALAVYRPGAELAAAFRRDVARLDLDRRLTQREVEHLLLHVRRPEQAQDAISAAEPLERLEAQLDDVLAAGGAARAATELSRMLAATERPGPVIGPVLEQLAFDSRVDLEAARRLLLAIWNSHQRGPVLPPSPSPPSRPVPRRGAAAAEETLGQRLARTLDEGLRQKQDVESLFRQLEEMAGIEPDELAEEDEEDEDEDAAGAEGSAIAGDLEPLVQEYLWEMHAEGGPAARTLRLLTELQHNAALQRTDLELITGQDLVRLLLHVWLSAAPTQRQADATAAFAAITAFYQWAETNHDLQLGNALRECQVGFVDHCSRLQAAGLALSTGQRGAEKPSLLRVEDLGPRGFGVRSDGDEGAWIEAGPAIAANLRDGDFLLAALLPAAAGHATLAGMVIAMPAAAEGLLG